MSETSTLHFPSSIDLSHDLDEMTPPYPGDPKISVHSLADIPSSGYALTSWSSVFHTGTHLDAPSHFIPGGSEIRDFPNQGIFTACLGSVEGISLLEPSHLQYEIPQGTEILLLRTGWGSQYGSNAYFHDHPVLSEALAYWIIDRGFRVVGFDLPSPDQAPYPIHNLLLGKGIFLLENLNRLERLPADKVFPLVCVPVSIRAEAFWVRPLALIP